VIPEIGGEVLKYAKIVNKDHLIAVYMVNVVDQIRVFNLHSGKFLFKLDTPLGTISSIRGNGQDSEFFYKVVNFLTPGIVYRYDFNAKSNQLKVRLFLFIHSY